MYAEIDVGEFDKQDRLSIDMGPVYGCKTASVVVNLLLERRDIEELVTKLRKELRKQDPDESYWDDAE